MRTFFCSLKLIFFIYILFNFNIVQASSNEIHVRYNDQNIRFGRDVLELMEISNVAKLVEAIKLKHSKELSNKVITLRRGQDEDLNSDTPISELYNTKDSVYEVVINGKHHIRLFTAVCDF